MLFNSATFPFFLILALFLYYATGRHLRLQNLVLVLLSCLFYSRWDARFLGLLALSTTVAYTVGLALHYTESAQKRRALLTLALALDLGLLAFFKYYNFFLESAQQTLRLLGLTLSPQHLEIILPVGISFYTFHTMSYVIDVYRGDFRACRDPIAFACYVAFFPLLVAGPIERAGSFLTQIVVPRRTSYEQVYTGTYLILWGLFLKAFVGDNLTPLVDRAFAQPGRETPIGMALGALAFSLQLYADFAGYSQVARGVARLMGFELSRNFNLPFLSVSPIEFWRRWHITLSTWLRDYLYIPLGGSQRLIYRNLLLTMALGGLWHGAHWKFALWGAYHGVLLCLYRALPFLGERPWGLGHARLEVRVLARAFWTTVTFGLVVVGFAIFRVERTEDLMVVLPALCQAPAAWASQGLTENWLDFARLAFYGLPLLVCDLAAFLFPVQRWMTTVIWPLRTVWYLLLFYSIVLLGGAYGKAFYYFQF